MPTLNFSECFQIAGGFCFVDWDAVEKVIVREGDVANLGEYFSQVSREWVVKMAEAQGGEAQVFETTNLLVMASRSGIQQRDLGRKFERALEKILGYLGRAAECERWGKLVILIFDDPHSYSSYAAQFYPENSVVPLSGGICLNRGYVHLAFYEEVLEQLMMIFVHEVTHAYLCHQMLPTWMDEAIAMRMEELVAGRPGLELNQENFRRHQKHWDRQQLEHFRSGESWEIAGDSFTLSYPLAEILWRKLESNLKASPGELQDLIIKSTWEDGGDAALQEVFGIGLNDLFQSFLGKIS